MLTEVDRRIEKFKEKIKEMDDLIISEGGESNLIAAGLALSIQKLFEIQIRLERLERLDGIDPK